MATSLGLSQRETGILDSIPEPVVIVDNQRAVVAVNRAAARDIGVGYAGRALALSLRHPVALAAVEEVLARGVSRSVEVTFRTPTQRSYSMMAAPLQALNGAAAEGAVLVFHDVTSERRAQQMRADFVANASHELRSPLSAVVGFIETLRGPAKDDAAARARFLDVMAQEAERMTKLVEDLLSLSAIEADEHLVPQGTVAVAPLVQRVADSLGERAAARGVQIRVDVPDALPPLAGDADQLAQVFRNLIENAITYGRPHTEVRVTAQAVERVGDTGRPGVAVTVEDQGDGIPAEHIPRLTERFYRVDPGRSRKLGGTGLGLAIVKHILNRHRGRLTIASDLGRGSRFTVTLPTS
jgi:two-component system phosphate regulon sensor histidine kinase PhoR